MSNDESPQKMQDVSYDGMWICFSVLDPAAGSPILVGISMGETTGWLGSKLLVTEATLSFVPPAVIADHGSSWGTLTRWTMDEGG